MSRKKSILERKRLNAEEKAEFHKLLDQFGNKHVFGAKRYEVSGQKFTMSTYHKFLQDTAKANQKLFNERGKLLSRPNMLSTDLSRATSSEKFAEWFTRPSNVLDVDYINRTNQFYADMFRRNMERVLYMAGVDMDLSNLSVSQIQAFVEDNATLKYMIYYYALDSDYNEGNPNNKASKTERDLLETFDNTVKAFYQEDVDRIVEELERIKGE